MQSTFQLLFKPSVFFWRPLIILLEFKVNRNNSFISTSSVICHFQKHAHTSKNSSKAFDSASLQLLFNTVNKRILEICVEEGSMHNPTFNLNSSDIFHSQEVSLGFIKNSIIL